jgi:hypothetical protein
MQPDRRQTALDPQPIDQISEIHQSGTAAQLRAVGRVSGSSAQAHMSVRAMRPAAVFESTMYPSTSALESAVGAIQTCARSGGVGRFVRRPELCFARGVARRAARVRASGGSSCAAISACDVI